MKKTIKILLCFSLIIINNLYSYDKSKDKGFDKALEKYYQIYNSSRTALPGLRQHILKYKIKPLEYIKQKESKRDNSIKKRKIGKKSAGVMSDIKPFTISEPIFKKGEMYCYPNPAKGINPKFHIETGIADMAEIEVYDITGKKVDGIKIEGTPQIIDDGQGPEYAYETEWDTTNTGSGVYIIYVRSYRGDKKIEGRFKCAVIK
jgi:hypothetical protein